MLRFTIVIAGRIEEVSELIYAEFDSASPTLCTPCFTDLP